jgi:signal transduction histidine kinase
LSRSAAILVVRIVVLTAIYVATARFGLHMDAVSGFATLVWPPTGVSLAALVVFGRALWPGVAIGAFVANVWSGAPVAVAAGIALGNTAEAWLGAYALRRVADWRPSLDRVRDVVALVALPALGSTAVSATIGVSSLWLAGIVSDDLVRATWAAWWLGDVVADLVVAPLLLVWLTKPSATSTPQPWIEVLTLGTATLVVSALIFGAPPTEAPFAWRQPYFLFPVLAWAALRAGQRGTTLTVFAVSAFAIWGTAMGQGPFARPTLAASLYSLQTFMAVGAAMALTLAAATTERLRGARDLEDAVKARDAFLSIASHELRTPLSALQLQVDLLARTRADVPDAARRIERIARQVARLTKLVNDLLDVSRVTAGSLHLEPETVELHALVVDAVARQAAEAQRAGVRITVEARQLPIYGDWDRGRLEQVFDNLLTNAIKYGGGQPIDFLVERAGRTATVSVTDRGIGIPAEHHARVFERFERAASAKSYGGLGLGLWIVKEIVSASGGTIHVTSQAGEGATFVVALPCHAPSDQAGSEPSYPTVGSLERT